MVSKQDCCASDLDSIPGQVNFLENFILLNSSKIRRELWKNTNVCTLFPDTIVFYCVLTSYTALYEGSTLIFNDVLLNAGDGWV